MIYGGCGGMVNALDCESGEEILAGSSPVNHPNFHVSVYLSV